MRLSAQTLREHNAALTNKQRYVGCRVTIRTAHGTAIMPASDQWKKHGMTVPAVWTVRQLLDNPHWVRATEATDPLESAVGTIGAFVSVAKPNYLVTANGRLLEHNDDDLLGQHAPEILAGYGSYSLPCDKPMSRGSSMDKEIRTPVTPVSIPSTEPAITDPVSVPELASSASLSPRRDAAR